ncbi:hypothetical protein FRC07_002052 [Ceratobasidium sp. 392]|nr:hypothetical protein FRC07_002052 [Ceratobasidium sp. 392]
MNAYQPATELHNRLERALLTFGFYQSATNLLTGIVITTMALITTAPQFVLKPIAINHILSLSDEISILCAIYKVNVIFQFDSIMETPADILHDFITLNISGAMLSNDPIYWKRSNRSLAETQILLNFLELVRTIMNQYGPHRVADIIADFDHKSSLHLPPTAIRKPGVGHRVVNPFRSANHQLNSPAAASSARAHILQALRVHAKSSLRFKPFAFRTRMVQPSAQGHVQLDLNDEGSPTLLSDAPLRMRRRRRFGFGGF